MAKRPRTPISLSNLVYSICQNPSVPRSREGIEYLPDLGPSGLNNYGPFLLKVQGDEVNIKGKFFRVQADLDDYLLSRGIAVRRSLVDLEDIRRASQASGLLLLEALKYNGQTISQHSISRAKAFLKVPAERPGLWEDDSQFLGTKDRNRLVHARSKDLITPDEWVPLYRQGSILGTVEEDRPVNLAEVTHVIF